MSVDNPGPAGEQMLWTTCSQLVESGDAVLISTTTPMSSAGNNLVCSADVGPAHMHIWAGPDSFSMNVANTMCKYQPVETVTWWPLG